MANLDPHVASVLDHAPAKNKEDDEDALMDELENDDALGAYREKRLQQLHSEFSRAKQLRNSEHGSYTEIVDEKKLMDITTSTKYCVVHFWKPDFARCRILDSHFDTLAPLHLDTRFLRINVENSPFLITRLKIQVLPCVLAFIDGVSADRIVGFEGIGRGHDRFTTRELESRLLQAKVLTRPKVQGDAASSLPAGPARRGRVNDDDIVADDDWD